MSCWLFLKKLLRSFIRSAVLLVAFETTEKLTVIVKKKINKRISEKPVVCTL